MNDSSNRIKTGFILAICADAAFDTFLITYLVEQYLRNDILSSNPLDMGDVGIASSEEAT